MNTIGIFYGSTTGATRRIAGRIRDALGHDNAQLVDVKSADVSDLDKYDNLIFGASTWGVGQVREDWEKFLPELEGADLKGKKVALFGIGDQTEYDKSFVDGLDSLATAVERAGGRLVGQWPTDGYNFTESRAVRNNMLVGLAIDEENQPELTDSRLSGWLVELQHHFA